MPKFDTKVLLKSCGKKLLHPIRFRRYMQAARTRGKVGTVADNPQLKLYAKILPGDFLHYGYFDDPNIKPQEISLQDFYAAQLRYAELLIEQADDKTAPVLDAGCGLGGLVQVLMDQKFSPVALTPDKFQIDYLRTKYPDTQLLHMKFEDLPLQQFEKTFGTVIHSESIQYMKLEQVFPIVEHIMKPGGRWIICDYFRIGEAAEKSGFRWELFTEKLDEHGFEISYQRDISQHIRPTLAYIYMWATQIGVPILDFVTQKLERKKPALHYLLEEAISNGRKSLDKQLDIVDPEVFIASKRYMLMTITRRAKA